MQNAATKHNSYAMLAQLHYSNGAAALGQLCDTLASIYYTIYMCVSVCVCEVFTSYA